jgi:putative acyl-CoA dehydrogenase
MTFAVVPALRHQPDVAETWIPRVTSAQYDPRFIPARDKTGATMGMAMTEKQGGSDVRANTTRAEPLGAGGPGQAYHLTGHKWFCSAPMSDAFLTLAHTPSGLTCFLVPRFLPDGTQNRFFIQRLKDKLGNRSNASSEIEYQDTYALMVGEEGRGVPTIIDMVAHTRLDCVSGTAGLMRWAVAQACHHARYRAAFGKKLADQPLMKNVLADLVVESEAATALALRLARAYDQTAQHPEQGSFARLATAVGKYWVCKRGPNLAFEAMECLGGAGYVEESFMPRIYREMPLSSIWEGSGNVMCLDVLRALNRQPDAWAVFMEDFSLVRGGDKRLDAAIDHLQQALSHTDELQYRARYIAELMARVLQGSLLVRFGHAAVAEAFCASRLAIEGGTAYGTLPRGIDVDAIIERGTPNDNS